MGAQRFEPRLTNVAPLFCFLLLITPLVVQDRPLLPAWSPDHRTLATSKVDQQFVTPEGANYQLALNSRLVYPLHAKHQRGYSNQHTFLTEFVWSPDSQQLAFVEEVYDWSYSDPYNRDFYGEVTKRAYYLAIITLDGQAQGYMVPVKDKSKLDLQWINADQLTLNGETFSLRDRRPESIP